MGEWRSNTYRLNDLEDDGDSLGGTAAPFSHGGLNSAEDKRDSVTSYKNQEGVIQWSTLRGVLPLCQPLSSLVNLQTPSDKGKKDTQRSTQEAKFYGTDNIKSLQSHKSVKGCIISEEKIDLDSKEDAIEGVAADTQNTESDWYFLILRGLQKFGCLHKRKGEEAKSWNLSWQQGKVQGFKIMEFLWRRRP